MTYDLTCNLANSLETWGPIFLVIGIIMVLHLIWDISTTVIKINKEKKHENQ